MTPSPMLDFWQKPADAGEPVALLATTFALEPDFFEQDCLARFLEVSSVDENTGSVDDIVASVELHELLQRTCVTVLADRSAPVQRTSLLWDLLGCKVDGALLHSKVAVLMWENATRVILGSMNLTSAGYRRQIELGLAADLGSDCLFPPAVLRGIERELTSYLPLVPGYDAASPVFARAIETLEMFRQRLNTQRAERTKVRVAFAPTNARSRPLDVLGEVWSAGQPLWATHLSPFWDTGDRAVLEAVRKLLTGRPAADRSHHVGVVLGPRGQRSFPHYLAEAVDSVHELDPLDSEVRTLHAKCLLIESRDWVAALVGSSNHTQKGLGLTKSPHREMNVWIGAPRRSKEGNALLDLIRLGRVVDADAEEVEPNDEDEVEVDLPALPACFELCRASRAGDSDLWELSLGIRTTRDMPGDWSVSLPGDAPVLTRQRWEGRGSPDTTSVAIPSADSGQLALPMCVFVRWDDCEVPWAVVADDRHSLPPGPALAGLRAQHLLAVLAGGRSIGDVLREEHESTLKGVFKTSGPDLDPLKRLEVHGSLLRRGRELAASLSAMQRRLERQVITLEALNARLTAPLGPEFLATKVAEAYEAEEQDRPWALFTIAEMALTVARVDWLHVIEHVDRERGLALVGTTLDRLAGARSRVGTEPADIDAYADRAIQEARQWVAG